MLRAEDNQFLTESGPGTGMGELLRRFWLHTRVRDALPESALSVWARGPSP